ncbi:Mps one binder kinase activator-like 3 [Tupaia chinensis]|uniref:Mps one binder kinase activator-like 3 n=1 Tax=Tupaia chinensis TaxID=246437 RepID=L9KJ30_TUPCH|nr:Mps one binder kinase activator-like 3 [Tupaia chinensis]
MGLLKRSPLCKLCPSRLTRAQGEATTYYGGVRTVESAIPDHYPPCWTADQPKRPLGSPAFTSLLGSESPAEHLRLFQRAPYPLGEQPFLEPLPVFPSCPAPAPAVPLPAVPPRRLDRERRFAPPPAQAAVLYIRDFYNWPDESFDEMDSTLAVPQYIQQNIRADCSNIDKILEPPEGQDEGVWKYEHLRVSIKESSVAKLGSVCRRIYRIFSHAYFHHRQIFDEYENETFLCHRFTKFVMKYNLMSKDNLIVPILEEEVQNSVSGESEA